MNYNRQVLTLALGCLLTLGLLFYFSHQHGEVIRSSSKSTSGSDLNESDDEDGADMGSVDLILPNSSKRGELLEKTSRKDSNNEHPAISDTLLPFRNATIRFRPALTQYTDKSIDEAYEALVREYLAPWNGLNAQGVPAVKITQRMLSVMEYAYKGGGFRVRIVGNRIYFRKLVHWKQTYRTQRMLWYLRLLYEIVRKDKLISAQVLERGIDFVIYVGDGAKVASDTFTVEAGYPLFSLRTSMLHIDIPIPDPVQHGSNGNYKWTEGGKRIPWEERETKLIFRGRGSCLKMHADNWHFCNRIRLQRLSQKNQELIDAGIIQWNQIYKSAKMVVPPATSDEIENSTGIELVPEMSFDVQSRYKYIIDIDGGLGSSRKPGILSSGSLLFAGESPWYTYYEPLMEPFKHYIPIDRWLRNVKEEVEWAKDHDKEAKRIMEEGRRFEAKFLSVAASKKYMAILLTEYSKLMAEKVSGNSPVEVDYCSTMGNKDIEKGPMGCSQEWVLYNDREIPPEIIADKK